MRIIRLLKMWVKNSKYEFLEFLTNDQYGT